MQKVQIRRWLTCYINNYKIIVFGGGALAIFLVIINPLHLLTTKLSLKTCLQFNHTRSRSITIAIKQLRIVILQLLMEDKRRLTFLRSTTTHCNTNKYTEIYSRSASDTELL